MVVHLCVCVCTYVPQEQDNQELSILKNCGSSSRRYTGRARRATVHFILTLCTSWKKRAKMNIFTDFILLSVWMCWPHFMAFGKVLDRQWHPEALLSSGTWSSKFIFNSPGVHKSLRCHAAPLISFRFLPPSAYTRPPVQVYVGQAQHRTGSVGWCLWCVGTQHKATKPNKNIYIII